MESNATTPPRDPPTMALIGVVVPLGGDDGVGDVAVPPGDGDSDGVGNDDVPFVNKLLTASLFQETDARPLLSLCVSGEREPRETLLVNVPIAIPVFNGLWGVIFAGIRIEMVTPR
jgi:hypothetical protein